MRLTLVRAFQDFSVTLGMLQAEGQLHSPIFTLENPSRATRTDSLIPAGTYVCKPHSSEKHPDTYEICGVPRRSAILIHTGNYETDTSGCILVGLAAGKLNEQVAVMQSLQAMNMLRRICGKQVLTLQVIDVFTSMLART